MPPRLKKDARETLTRLAMQLRVESEAAARAATEYPLSSQASAFAKGRAKAYSDADTLIQSVLLEHADPASLGAVAKFSSPP